MLVIGAGQNSADKRPPGKMAWPKINDMVITSRVISTFSFSSTFYFNSNRHLHVGLADQTSFNQSWGSTKTKITLLYDERGIHQT